MGGKEAEKLEALRARIRAAEDASGARERKRARAHAGLPAGGAALMGRVAVELVTGVAVGGFAGWLLDNWLGTTPFLMIVLLFAGAAAGTLNLWRMASGHGLTVGYGNKHGKQGEKTEGKNNDKNNDKNANNGKTE